MKKILGILVLLLCSCVPDNHQLNEQEENIEVKTTIESKEGYYSLIEITIDGEVHEYIKYSRHDQYRGYFGLAHWEGCKYCKKGGEK